MTENSWHAIVGRCLYNIDDGYTTYYNKLTNRLKTFESNQKVNDCNLIKIPHAKEIQHLTLQEVSKHIPPESLAVFKECPWGFLCNKDIRALYDKKDKEMIELIYIFWERSHGISVDWEFVDW